MKEKIKNILLGNLWKKVLAFALGFVFWLIITNISNPDITGRVTVPLRVESENELSNDGKTYTLSTQTVSVSYTVRNNDRNRISASNFDAYVDLADYSITGSVPVYVVVDTEAQRYISNISISPVVVMVSTEDYVKRTFDIHTNVVGEAGVGKAIGDLELSATSVTCSGSSSSIGEIASVGLEIQLDSNTSDVSGTANLVFYDSLDNPIELSSDVQVSGSVSYLLHIYNTKRCAVDFGYVGEPAEGYSVSSLSCDPISLVVAGPDDVFNSYSTIIIPDTELTLSGAQRNVAITVDATDYLPEGLFFVEDSQVSIVATVVRTDTLPTNFIPPTNNIPTTNEEATAFETESQTTVETAEGSSGEESIYPSSKASETTESYVHETTASDESGPIAQESESLVLETGESTAESPYGQAESHITETTETTE